jgi:tetratricopeptide (TPR) repeat protein
VLAPRPSDWPFLHPLVPPIPADCREIDVVDLHEAFVNHQTSNTRLVTTNPNYLLQVWLYALEDNPGLQIVATADPKSLEEHAPEALARRGPFASPAIRIELVESSGTSAAAELPTLARAMRVPDPQTRLALCIEALNERRDAPSLLAAASSSMEAHDLDAAGRDLEDALGLAPNWPAVHFEYGKLWLRRDDMERAAAAFQRATTLLPNFTAGWANLGATLGELDRPQEALAAFETALAQDPDNPQALNNVGVVRRELGRLDESVAAFRQVTHLVPERAFGYYNLGHTLATRLAMCRLAAGDAATALADLQRATASLPRDYKRQLLADTQAVAWALLTHRPDIAGWGDVNTWIGAELAKLA